MEELIEQLQDITAQLDVDLVCTPGHLGCLRDIARNVDLLHPAPPEDYTLGEAVSTIINGGTREDIQLTLALLKGWSFKPREERNPCE